MQNKGLAVCDTVSSVSWKKYLAGLVTKRDEDLIKTSLKKHLQFLKTEDNL